VLTFSLYGPNNSSCSGAPLTTTQVNVSGNGSYTSPNSTPTAAGTYYWVASYGGDSNNPNISEACGGNNESVVITPAQPGISTSASGGVNLGGGVHDVANLSGGYNPTGTITFSLYGPNNATCSGSPVFTTQSSVSGNGGYTSSSFTPTAGGTYYWVASYSGDGNDVSATEACGGNNESVVVTSPPPPAPPTAAQPSITTNASANTSLGGGIHDTATLAGGSSPTGTITFSLYGPNDNNCSGGAIATQQVGVTGNGSYVSPGFTPSQPGTYNWVASYSGDANNVATTAACGAANESVNVIGHGNAHVSIANGCFAGSERIHIVGQHMAKVVITVDYRTKKTIYVNEGTHQVINYNLSKHGLSSGVHRLGIVVTFTGASQTSHYSKTFSLLVCSSSPQPPKFTG